MKFFLAAALIVSAFSAHAGWRTKRFTHTLSAPTKAEAMSEVERAIPLIKTGVITSVWQRDCRPNNNRTITIQSVNFQEYYVVGPNGDLVPRTQATIRYKHSRCFEGR